MEQYEYIAHHGIRGMRWGVRNYQNEDGSLTSAGRLRYGIGSAVGGGLYDSSKTLSGRAKKLAKFGSSLGKAKAEHYGRSISGKASGTMRRIGNALNTQRSEAERLRSYAHSLEMKRTLQMSINNLRGQKEYNRRKDAAKNFIREMGVASHIVGVASNHRFHARSGRRVQGEISADLYKFLTNHGSSAKEAISEMFGDISESNNNWRRSARTSMNEAHKWRSIARGH